MAEYISRAEIMGKITSAEMQKEFREMTGQDAYAIFIAMLNDIPKADAVEVVRCEGCKYWRRNIGIADSPNGHCFIHDDEMNCKDFCAYGKGRNDNGLTET